jgi:nitrate reductase delta subunit
VSALGRRNVAAAPAQVRDRDRARVLASTSLLLGYPDRALYAELPTIGYVAKELPRLVAGCLCRFSDYLSSTPPAELAATYVGTFDLRRRCCLYLTYYGFGDTRKRGVALLRFTDTYRRAGFDPPEGELPDHLAVVCNFAALAPEAGLELLAEHRAAIEVLRLALREAGSAYLDVVDALRAVLPEPTERDLAKAWQLARTGPPAEEVGLEPFAPPEYMGGRR